MSLMAFDLSSLYLFLPEFLDEFSKGNSFSLSFLEPFPNKLRPFLLIRLSIFMMPVLLSKSAAFLWVLSDSSMYRIFLNSIDY